MAEKTFSMKVVVLCHNSEGSPEFHHCSVEVTQQEMANGAHYDRAKESASEHGYEAPMIAFDATDPAAKQLEAVASWL